MGLVGEGFQMLDPGWKIGVKGNSFKEIDGFQLKTLLRAKVPAMNCARVFAAKAIDE